MRHLPRLIQGFQPDSLWSVVNPRFVVCGGLKSAQLFHSDIPQPMSGGCAWSHLLFRDALVNTRLDVLKAQPVQVTLVSANLICPGELGMKMIAASLGTRLRMNGKL